jgi:hypothetical protein
MSKILTSAFLGLILLVLAGCQTTATPNIRHPGSTQAQQNRAVRFDPYPENETGPTLVGVRPREYENPISEPARARWHLGN